MNNLFPYKWKLSEGFPNKKIKKHGKKVFGTFVCGGGSTMGYKLSGFNHLGGVELDEKIANIYKANHNPSYFYNIDLRNFNNLSSLNEELFNLDLLDGSPPCSSFSMAGNREKDWQKNKRFMEGQKKQRLDDLVFVYCDTIKKLRPKVFLLENVKGMIQGNAKAYVRKIVSELESVDYKIQIFLINSASLGVPQRRERVFIIGYKKNFKFPKLILNFNEKPICLNEFSESHKYNDMTNVQFRDWKNQTSKDRNLSQVRKRVSGFTDYLLAGHEVCPTISANGKYFLKKEPRWLTKNEFCSAGSFPTDYNFKNSKPQYIIGMSVPPIMTAQIANQIYLQWLKKI